MIADYFAGNSLWYLVKQSDPISKLTLWILFGISVLCWTVFLSKLILFYIQRRSLRKAHRQLQAVKSIDELVLLANNFVDTVPGRLLAHCLLTLDTLLRKKMGRDMRNWDLVQYHIDQAVDVLVANEESYLSTLSTSAAVAPLLGLFGTVWGLVHAFIRISEKQAADITVVAPGIAEALLTTLAGLMVAIPALIMYNYLVVRVRRVEHQIVQFADQISLIMQQSLIE
jgi:biopolymer transport protein ExbB/TolQ